MPNPEPLKLSRENYWQELEAMRKDGTLPLEVVDTLKSLISSHFNHTFGPEARGRVLAMVREHLKGGIFFSDTNRHGGITESLHDVGVVVPDDLVKGRSFFILLPKYPGGTVMRLGEFNGNLPVS